MRKFVGIVSACALCLLATGGECALRVVTTTTDLAALTRAVGGEFVDVYAVAKGAQDPHYVAAKPSYIRQVNRADLLVYNGLELEVAWLPLLIEGARNRALTPGSAGLLDASEVVERLEIPRGDVDRSQGDIHPEGNPHYLLDPRNGVLVARLIADRIGQLDPDHAADYAAALTQFEADMARQIEGWELRLRATEDTSLLAFHRTWTYLAAWAGIRIANYIEEKPGIPPGPRHLASLVDQMATEGIRAIALAHYNPTRSGKALAERSGARLLVLPAAVEAFDDVAEYADLFDRIVSDLETVGRGTP
ncbi:zinc ABC transporter substrate-binding protein [Candidatus Poribacteria bacterium]|jgi:zinc/manganese transport system substrate-binding protein|nr:zinc ABC transporter substrate-binding protein [Candidatus Poribacteria bacterium]MBT5533806.1 zinc ABC transporter substrate-binding protein [Candidatus Poribacteria bacterium]MBT5713875.1 zinc ABC transporter substrate-binding protein [Candidatus Poribacteria bacterium]MBT7101353.1 zinc ABC transporter substrate-binding protein [Candidatus Poribacteria bacterium]MBT7806283.1 zinc ABC transporter substrate-binding protein [Candidatus Poribacteria bacterium]